MVGERDLRAHNPEVAGSNPAPATKKPQVKGHFRKIVKVAQDRLTAV